MSLIQLLLWHPFIEVINGKINDLFFSKRDMVRFTLCSSLVRWDEMKWDEMRWWDERKFECLSFVSVFLLTGFTGNSFFHVLIQASFTRGLCPKILREDALSPQKNWLLCLRVTLMVLSGPFQSLSFQVHWSYVMHLQHMEDFSECSCHTICMLWCVKWHAKHQSHQIALF